MNRGFTLLEVVAALALLGIGMGVAMQIFSGGLKNVHRVSQAHKAMNHAENIMNEILSDETIVSPIEISEDLDDDFSYVAVVDYWDPPADELSLDLVEKPMEILSVVVDIHFKNDPNGKKYRAICLKSVSLAPELGPAAGMDEPLRQLFGIQ
jgi:prepilin-type N-terminal cleavage/methylation domain-containing protein